MGCGKGPAGVNVCAGSCPAVVAVCAGSAAAALAVIAGMPTTPPRAPNPPTGTGLGSTPPTPLSRNGLPMTVPTPGVEVADAAGAGPSGVDYACTRARETDCG